MQLVVLFDLLGFFSIQVVDVFVVVGFSPIKIVQVGDVFLAELCLDLTCLLLAFWYCCSMLFRCDIVGQIKSQSS
jgi:hypothetical protein